MPWMVQASSLTHSHSAINPYAKNMTAAASNTAPVWVTLVNTGARPHTFTIDELDVHVSVAPGEMKVITIRPLRLGQFFYYSDTPEDRALGMKGIMSIFI
jgi:Cupredoxin-like domain